MLARELELPCALFCFVLDNILIFQVWTGSHRAIFLFRSVLEYSRHVCLCAIWQSYQDPAVGSCFVQRQPVAIHQVMSFWGMTIFFVNGHALLFWLFPVIQSDMLNDNQCPAYLFLSFCLSLPTLHQVQYCVSCNRVWFLFNVLFLMWLLLLILHPNYWVFYIQGFEMSVSCCHSWSGSVHKVHIALWEVQVIAHVA